VPDSSLEAASSKGEEAEAVASWKEMQFAFAACERARGKIFMADILRVLFVAANLVKPVMNASVAHTRQRECTVLARLLQYFKSDRRDQRG
jgi:hypothetical protein